MVDAVSDLPQPGMMQGDARTPPKARAAVEQMARKHLALALAEALRRRTVEDAELISSVATDARASEPTAQDASDARPASAYLPDAISSPAGSPVATGPDSAHVEAPQCTGNHAEFIDFTEDTSR